MTKNKQVDITVIGNVGIDTNIYHSGKEIDFDVEANFTENLDYIGQAGGYAARGFAQLGCKTAFIGYIGDDYHGKNILQKFHDDNIDTSGIFIDPAGTSRSVNFMFPDGRRKNFYDGKSHMELAPDLKICENILVKSKILHFHIPNWARRLLPMAREMNIPISTDIQDVVDLNDHYRKDFIKYSDIIFFSAVNFDSPEIFINHVWQKYPGKILIAGLGKKGCALAAKGIVEYFSALEFGAPVIDTNGAGDGLAVGFLSYYLLEGKSLEESIKAGQVAARYTCTQKASTDALINRRLLNEMILKS